MGGALNFLFGLQQSQVDQIHRAVKINFRNVMAIHGPVHSLHEQLSNMSETMESEMQTIWSAMDASHHQIEAVHVSLLKYAYEFQRFGNAVSI